MTPNGINAYPLQRAGSFTSKVTDALMAGFGLHTGSTLPS